MGLPAVAAAGMTYGSTDDLGYKLQRPVHVHDVQATILHLLDSTTNV